jgi:hypothetical protein
MMREAKKMMQDPAFQAHCRQLMEGQGFQQAMTQVKTDLADPAKAKELEEKTKVAIQKGEEELEQLQKQVESAKQEGPLLEEMNKKGVEKQDTDSNDDYVKPAPDTNVPDIPDMPDIPSLNIN